MKASIDGQAGIDARREDPQPAMPGAWRTQALLGLEASCALARGPASTRPSVRHAARLNPQGEGRRFAQRKGSLAGVLVPMIVVSSLVDVPLAHLAIHAAAASHAAELHSLVILANLWMLLWAIGLRSAVRHIDHVLHADALVLAIGFGAVCRIPLAEVKDAHVLSRRQAGWRDERGLKRGEVARLTPIDEPTLLIELHTAHEGCRLVRHRRERPVPAWVAVYVDEPASLRSALLAATAKGA